MAMLEGGSQNLRNDDDTKSGNSKQFGKG